MPPGRPKSAAGAKRTEAVQALLTPEERTAFDQLVTQMADELGAGTISDGLALRRLILAELKRRGIYPPIVAAPSPKPVSPGKRSPTK